MAGFLAPLIFKDLGNRHFQLTRAVEFHVGGPDSPRYVHVPRGFVTDLASIPRLLWNILPPIGSYDQAGVVHDWLYTTRIVHNGHRSYVTRAEADAILLEGMGVLGTRWWVRYPIYWGVRLGGWHAWRQHRKEDRA